MADGVAALAQLYALYSHRARYFNQWQRALYPNFIIKRFGEVTSNIWTTECYIIGNNKISNINIDFPQNLQRHNHTDEQINFLWLLPLDEHAPPFLGSEFQVFFFPEVKIRIHLNGVVSYQLVTNYNFWPPLLLRTVTVLYGHYHQLIDLDYQFSYM